MELNEFIGLQLDYVKRGLTKVLDGLNQQELSWRPACGCNSIGLILFHVVRSEDSFVRGRIQGKPQIWVADKWYQKFEMAETESGAHFTPDQVNSFKVPEIKNITDYFEAVRTDTRSYLASLKPADFDRKFQTPYFGEISVGTMFSFVIGHEQGHVGEMGYLRGLQKGIDK